MTKIFITGVTGFIGSQLAKTLVREYNYDVYGLIRFSANENREAVAEIPDEVNLKVGNLIDHHRIRKILEEGIDLHGRSDPHS